jgi:hypothetical protein
VLGARLGAKSRHTFYAGIIEGTAVVALAETLGLPRVATTDRRHFAPLAAALSLELVP